MKRFSIVLTSLVFGLTISSCAPSAAQKAILDVPSVNEVSGGLNNKLYWLKNNAQSGGNYVLEVKSHSSRTKEDNILGLNWDLSYKDKSNITITIIGVGENWIISRGEPGTLFNVGSGVTLVLENITLQGIKKAYMNIHDVEATGPLISVSSGGTLVMNDGSVITGNQNNSGDGGGVRVSGGGNFLMKGGTISGNECFPVTEDVIRASISGGIHKAHEKKFYGGGVYVAGEVTLFGKTTPGGNFTKTGGTITGYNGQKDANTNVVSEFYAQGVSQNQGHAVYAGNKHSNKHRETTAGPDINLSFNNGKFSGDWDE
jgi:hypothetical protein